MSKLEFLQALQQRLARLSDHELGKSLDFYAESIDDRMEDGMSEAEAVASLGSLEEIANGILLEIPLATIIQNRIQESRKKSGNKKLWTILAICGSPFWVPLALGFAAVLFALYICVWAVVVCLIAVAFSLGLGGLAGIVVGFFRFFATGVITGLTCVGLGLACSGLFLICLRPVVSLCKQFVGLTKVTLRKIKGIFMGNGGAAV